MYRPEHEPTGEVCMICGMRARLHRARGERSHRIDSRPSIKPVDRIIGIDGEGIGRDPHRYIYLAAVDERGLSWEASDPKRLSSQACLDMILSLPRRSLVVGFSFVYDLTKILQDLPDKALYLLFHEELRARLIDGKVLYMPIRWEGFKLNYMNRRFTVGRTDSKASTTIWDIFRFFQTSFVQSLVAWKVGDDETLQRMQKMKDSRATFDKLRREEIHAYCKEECAYLAKLARALIDAHDGAGLPLKNYYGAGSTASVFLRKVGISDQRGSFPDQMREPVACAFFGGRFENSFVGAYRQVVYDYDISSAYPYQTFRLPCLLCGRWSLHRRPSRSLSGTLSLVHWRSDRVRTNANWGTLPLRTKDGTIIFPLGAKGGWCWGEEFKAACQLSPGLVATEAWVYETDCNHRPFKDVPDYYRERVRLGKDSQGIVLKLGINSIYGKLAQSKGFNPPFQSWVWAGVITSNTRAQLLGAIARAKNPANILMLATDGVWSAEPLKLPMPDDTGTSDLAKPLGGWEEKRFDKGVFCVRPGIYFPIDPTEDEIEKVRARGLGRRALYERWRMIVDAWDANKPSISIGGMTRFVGPKSGILASSKGIKRRTCYGEWIGHTVDVSFSPAPKRQRINRDGSLKPWVYLDFESVPYSPATVSPEAMMLKLASQIAEEQPDGDFDTFTPETGNGAV